MAASQRMRDLLARVVPWWLSDRTQTGPGVNVGWTVLWTMTSSLDQAIEHCLQSLEAAWPGIGTSDALAIIARDRSMLQGRSETTPEFVARLGEWLDRARQLGSMLSVARAVHEYLRGKPRVRVVDRAGQWLTVNEDGSVETREPDPTTWDWDSVSHPERAGHWWNLWVIVDPPSDAGAGEGEWPDSGTWGDGELWGGTLGFGHDSEVEEYDAIMSLLEQHRSFHTFIRCVIFTDDAAALDPDDPMTLPDGTWGSWSLPGSDPLVAGGRDTDFRYWEPR